MPASTHTHIAKEPSPGCEEDSA